jgi:acyl-CoA dehydrogenase
MDFRDSDSAAAFRAEVRAWLACVDERFIPPAGAGDAEVIALARGWQSACAEAGYAGFGLPAEIGGRPGPLNEQVIFAQEIAEHPMAKVEMMALGCGMAIPTLLAHGTDEQMAALATATIKGDVLWCQLFSEPGAGSDLAGLRTRARRTPEGWVVDGQKVWTTGAEHADWGLLLARTDPEVPKHRGLTYFLLDMHSPGVTVRPLKQLSGRSEFCEVFLDDVHIPDDMRVGPAGAGWKVALSTLSNERLVLTANAGVGRNVIGPLIRLAERIPGPDGRPLLEDGGFRDKVSSYYVAVAGIERIAQAMVTAGSDGQSPGPEATIGKFTLTRLLQEMATYGMDLAGAAAGVLDSHEDPDLRELLDGFLLAPGYRMGGGTEEIAKNIIAERVLGLPPEPNPNKHLPFSQAT